MIEVRQAGAQDLEAILAIYNDAVINTTAVYDYVPRTFEAQASWYEAKRAHDLPVLVAVEEGEIAGFASFGPFRPWPAYLHTVENSIYVAPGRRGRGVGGRLLGPLVAAAQGRRLHAMIAAIDATNEASLRLHRKFAFEEVGHLRQVGWKFDRWLDLVLLERLL